MTRLSSRHLVFGSIIVFGLLIVSMLAFMLGGYTIQKDRDAVLQDYGKVAVELSSTEVLLFGAFLVGTESQLRLLKIADERLRAVETTLLKHGTDAEKAAMSEIFDTIARAKELATAGRPENVRNVILSQTAITIGRLSEIIQQRLLAIENESAVFRSRLLMAMTVLLVAFAVLLMLQFYLTLTGGTLPMRRASLQAQRVAHGDYTGRLPNVAPLREVRDLYTALNNMSTQLSERAHQIEIVSRLGKFGFMIFDTTDKTLTLSESAAQILGMKESGSHIHLTDLVERVEPPYRDALSAVFQTDLSEGDTRKSLDFRIRVSENQRADIFMEGDVHPEDPDLRMFFCQDVTDRQRVEQELSHAKQLAVVGEIVGGVAHDFNNLLSVIIWNLEDLSEQIGEGDGREQISEARAGAMRAADLTQRLLSFSRQQILQPKVTDVNDLINQTWRMLRVAVREQIEINSEIQRTPVHVNVDVGQVQNALLNLTLNASQAMSSEGRIKISVSSVDEVPERVDLAGLSPGRYAVISVADDGRGMNEEDLQRARRPFFTTRSDGTGLGLSSVEGFVEQSGGGLAIDSAPGVGTTVHMYLPLCEPVEDVSSQIKKTVKDKTGTDLHVLLVEDELPLLKVMQRVLDEAGFRVTTARNGEVATELLESDETFDLVLSDIMMPGSVTGADLAKRVPACQPDAAVILMSGYSTPEVGTTFASTLDLTVLSKPVRPKDLLTTIDAIMTNKQKVSP